MLTYLSLGAGTESGALLVMSALGLHGCPRADFAIFADTQDEPQWVYDQRDMLKAWAEPLGMPVLTITRGKLSADPVIRVPVFVKARKSKTNPSGKGSSPLTQNCTRDYKITPIRREVRRIMRERGIKTATVLMGVSLSEADRMSDSGRKWLTHAYPLIDAGMRRADCEDLLRDHGFPPFLKSACVYCPWHSAKAWLDVRDHDPDGWTRAIAYDERVRAQRKAAVHRSLIPLRDVSLKAQQGFDLDGFSNECSGHCGV
jgi:hypothetical protein